MTETWTTAAIKARLLKVGLTQEQLAERAGLDRPVVNALVNGRRKMTMYYAGKLAGPLRAKPAELLPPAPSAKPAETDPYVLLRRLAETVEKQQRTIDELLARVEVLERAGAKRRRASGDPR